MAASAHGTAVEEGAFGCQCFCQLRDNFFDEVVSSSG